MSNEIKDNIYCEGSYSDAVQKVQTEWNNLRDTMLRELKIEWLFNILAKVFKWQK